MLRLVLLAISVVLVYGGASRNADIIDVLFKNSKYPKSVIQDAKLGMVELVTKHGYPIESHEVVTKDGYILTLHRIPNGRKGAKPKNINAFIAHGLMGDATNAVSMGPDKSLAYILADEGYEVWLSNSRGTFHSRGHQVLNADKDSTYWNFSYEKIALYDIPASLEYIERVTGRPQCHFIGHSQGGTLLLVLNSLKPEYNKKFISFQATAPGYITRSRSPIISLLAPTEKLLELVALTTGTGEVLERRSFAQFCKTFCSITPAICLTLLYTLVGNKNSIDQNLVPMIFGNLNGVSIRQITHYGQNINAKAFRRFDEGPISNLALYGSTVPPKYNISLVTTPTYIYYAAEDTTVIPEDVAILASKLSNVVKLQLITEPDFGHFSFVLAENARDVVYNDIVTSMKHAEENMKNQP